MARSDCAENVEKKVKMCTVLGAQPKVHSAAEVLVLGAQCTAVVGAAEVCSPRWSHPSVVYDSISPQLPNSLQRNIFLCHNWWST